MCANVTSPGHCPGEVTSVCFEATPPYGALLPCPQHIASARTHVSEVAVKLWLLVGTEYLPDVSQLLDQEPIEVGACGRALPRTWILVQNGAAAGAVLRVYTCDLSTLRVRDG